MVSMSSRRTVIGQDSGLCGIQGGVMLAVSCALLWRPKQLIFKPAQHNSFIDVVVMGLKSSLSTRRQTTFSVADIS